MKNQIFSGFLLLFIVNQVAYGQNTLYGTIKKDLSYAYFYKQKENKFPIQHYSYSVNAYDLKYVGDGSELYDKAVINDLHHFRLEASADLELISFDQKSGYYKFKLTISDPSLDYEGLKAPAYDHGLTMKGGYRFYKPVQVKLLNGSDPIFYIEGFYKDDLISKKSNPYFDIEFTWKEKMKDINLVRLKELPIIVVTK